MISISGPGTRSTGKVGIKPRSVAVEAGALPLGQGGGDGEMTGS